MASATLTEEQRSSDNETSQNAQDLLDSEHARPRKRTRRACDKCSSSRTRCDGACPCRRCQEYGYSCRYNREVRKRGRQPANAAASNASNANTDSWDHRQSEDQANRSPSSSDLVSPDLSSASAQFPFPTPVLTNGDSLNGHRRKSVANGADAPHIIPRTDDSVRSHFPAPVSVASLIQSDLQPTPGVDGRRESRILPENGSSLGGLDGGFGDSEVGVSDESTTYASPANGAPVFDSVRRHAADRTSLPSGARNDRERGSFSTSATGTERFAIDFLHRAPSDECHYRFLEPVLPYIRNIVPASVACDLLDIFLTDPGSSLFRPASPYILTRIFRKKSILHRTNPRPTTPALLATILWCVSQTADIMLLHVPGTRAKIVNDLYDLATSLISERDPDRWRRIHGGLRAESEMVHFNLAKTGGVPMTTPTNEPAGSIDDVLTFILLSIAVSGGDFKSDSHKWWSKAVRLALSLRLNREDERCTASVTPCANPLCSCKRDQGNLTLASLEHREERRRVFWLLYSLDRHLALSFNSALSIPDPYCEVFAPLPDSLWENLDLIAPKDLPIREIGPPSIITGTGFLDFFLPLMAILGDIIEVHHRKEHPRLGGLDDQQSVATIQELLANCELSLSQLPDDNVPVDLSYPFPRSAAADMPGPGGGHQQANSPQAYRSLNSSQSKTHLVKAYSMHILHVLHVLLHGKWDAISMLDDGDDWITSKRFTECASHAISASHSVWTILNIDPELTFMSYLFGIYLLHGSFILLLFADRMPQLGPNESVEQACENIIRAHEVCVVTLSTEFQKNFRKVLRSTLYSVRGAGTTNWEEHRARRRALSLYRWTRGAKGLAL